jgi:hypothetical protein
VISPLPIALVLAERRLPFLAIVEDAKDEDHDLIGRLVERIGDEVSNF